MKTTKISFQGMDHSDPLEQHALEKLKKLEDILRKEATLLPFSIDLHLKSQPLHPHHYAGLNLKTPQLDLHSHDEGVDMYVMIDNAIDKMVTQIKRHKEKMRDNNRQGRPGKSEFYEDKYTLSEDE